MIEHDTSPKFALGVLVALAALFFAYSVFHFISFKAEFNELIASDCQRERVREYYQTHSKSLDEMGISLSPVDKAKVNPHFDEQLYDEEKLGILIDAYNADPANTFKTSVAEVSESVQLNFPNALCESVSYYPPDEQPYRLIDWANKKAQLVFVKKAQKTTGDFFNVGEEVPAYLSPTNADYVFERDSFSYYTYAWEYEAGQGESV